MKYFVEPCIGFHRNKQELEHGFHIKRPLPMVLEYCITYCEDYGRKFNQTEVYARFTVLSPNREKFVAMLFLEVNVPDVPKVDVPDVLEVALKGASDE